MYHGKKWSIDNVEAAYVGRGSSNGEYYVVFEQESASLEAIQAINWAHPEINRLKGARPRDLCLPAGYGFNLVGINFDCYTNVFTVKLRVADQFLGDVTGYQEEIRALTAANAAQSAQISDLTEQLAEADELAVDLYEAINAGDESFTDGADPETPNEEVE